MANYNNYSYDVTISIDQLTDEIEKILDDYENQVYASIEGATKAIAQKAKNAVRRNARATFKPYHRQRKYSNGWDLKQKSRVKGISVSYVIYNRNAPGLAHLLENGHASVNGKRVKAYPHIKPVQDEIDASLVSDIKSRIARIK